MENRSEIVFFDVETTIPTRTGQGYALLEFGAILVCPRKLVEQESYSTLVRPSDLSLISTLSVRCNGITRDAVTSAPTFADIADKVFDILHGRIWAGHNILKFDCPRIQEAFAGINRPAPEPKGTIDTLALLTERFGRRAGSMKMASLATYFGLGQQTHRSLDDVRMNFEVLKYCATVLFLESSLPDILTENSWVSPNAAIRRSRTNGNTTAEGMGSSIDTPSSSVKIGTPMRSVAEAHIESDNPISPLVSRNVEVPDLLETNSSRPDPFNLVQFSAEVRESIQSDDMEEEPASDSRDSYASTATGGYIGCTDFLEPNNISTSSISLSLSPLYRGIQKIQILHNNAELQACSRYLKVRFGISTRFVDYAGRPRLSFVVDASSELCQLLDVIDNLAQKFTEDTGSMSEWRPVVNRKPGFVNCPTIRLNLPTVVDGNISRWVTEIYQKESSTTQKLMFSRFDVAELDSLITPGTLLDAYFSIDSYDYQQIAGIRLVAKKLIVHSS
ncbi:protein NEN1-like isoform X1 [Lycium barbarum]|uniref:protein NEN1-like isoform X1 n=1 Tax=Lycium barbarum TaxID=112863 RepID=UPI00293E9FF5|nr:protein NEN1-like isoform X1 [Lycium barbarum]